jgi:hypothetical protein
MTQSSLFPGRKSAQPGPVECLGMQFENDEARREYFSERLREKLGDPEFRNTEDFPIATEEDILRLSDPPFYTACPNPFLEDFVRWCEQNRKTDAPITSQPYVGDLESSARHPVYSFHPYHTKVPPEIIRRLIEHYSHPGDIVLDAFCGTGMTGVAAREIGRYAVLVDLAPVATFISSVNCNSHDWRHAVDVLESVIRASESVLGRLYETEENGRRVPVNYFVWTDVFSCPECAYIFPFFPHGVIHHGNKVETRKNFPCPQCDAELNVRRVERVLTHRGKKKQLAWVNAGSGRARINREPNDYDNRLAEAIEGEEPATWYPTDAIDPNGYSARLAQLGDKQITDVSRFLSRRNLTVFADLWDRISDIQDPGVRRVCWATLSSIFTVVSERQGYFGGGGGMSGNLYMPIVRMEKNIYDSLRRKLTKLRTAEQAKEQGGPPAAISTQSATNLTRVPDNSIDYIYTDPPFGANIIYSEMNLILEGWLRVKMNAGTEAVIDVSRHREFDDYAALMRASFKDYYRVLKPGHWMTVEFHNTQASVWNLIQTAIGEGGFVVAQVGYLDKGSTTILADIRPGAAKYDLIISAYKPSQLLEEQFRTEAGSIEGAWDFVRSHLRQVPVFLQGPGGTAVPVTERQPHLLFDRMVAFHVQRRVSVPISAGEFYAGLSQRFAERDGMHFLPEQVAEYDRRRSLVNGVQQQELFVTDEVSAIHWIRQQLTNKPQTHQDLHPTFTREIQAWAKHEETVDLLKILEQNFLRYDGIGLVPSQIHAYLSNAYRDLRNLEKTDPRLREKARDRWYVPDPSKQAEREKIRERELLKEFEDYRTTKKKLKLFRTEAVRAGFKAAYDKQDYRTIVDVAHKLPESVLQEDEKLLMYYDVASMRLGD